MLIFMRSRAALYIKNSSDKTYLLYRVNIWGILRKLSETLYRNNLCRVQCRKSMTDMCVHGIHLLTRED